MSRADERPRAGGRSIAVSILVLVVAALVAATAVMFAVTFSGPPPLPAPQTYADIAQTLKAGRSPSSRGRQLGVHDGAAPPQARLRDQPNAHAGRRIAELLGVPFTDIVALTPPDNENGDEVRGPFQVGWRRGATWRNLATAPDRFITPWHRVTLGAMLTVLALLGALAWFVARAISRPLRQVADAALGARAGALLAPLPAGGATEVRDLSRAVATMHDRLQRHSEGRTIMLGAIAHDLGTPLSRLAFWIEQLPDAARMRAVADLDEMRAMIAATLSFARDESTRVEHGRVDLGSLLDALAEDMRVGGSPVTLVPGDRAIVRGDPGALRRLFGNVIENAVRYGGAAAISWELRRGEVAVTIHDDGPGLRGSDPERLFEPFVRGEQSRNRATGGSGLGLAIVRSIATRHGGHAALADHPEGGACASVTLPLA